MTTTPFVKDGGLLKATDVLYALRDGRTTEAEALELLKLADRSALINEFYRREVPCPPDMFTAYDFRAAEVPEMEAARAEEIANGNDRNAAIYAEAIQKLKGQLATYTPEAGEGHFLDSDGYTAAMAAFGIIGEAELQEVIAADVVTMFETGEITYPQTLADIAAEIAAGEAVEAQGHAVHIEGGRLVMNKGGNAYSLPIPEIEEPTE